MSKVTFGNWESSNGLHMAEIPFYHADFDSGLEAGTITQYCKTEWMGCGYIETVDTYSVEFSGTFATLYENRDFDVSEYSSPSEAFFSAMRYVLSLDMDKAKLRTAQLVNLLNEVM